MIAEFMKADSPKRVWALNPSFLFQKIDIVALGMMDVFWGGEDPREITLLKKAVRISCDCPPESRGMKAANTRQMSWAGDSGVHDLFYKRYGGRKIGEITHPLLRGNNGCILSLRWTMIKQNLSDRLLTQWTCAEWKGYTGLNVTRRIPISGKFNERSARMLLNWSISPGSWGLPYVSRAIFGISMLAVEKSSNDGLVALNHQAGENHSPIFRMHKHPLRIRWHDRGGSWASLKEGVVLTVEQDPHYQREVNVTQMVGNSCTNRDDIFGD